MTTRPVNLARRPAVRGLRGRRGFTLIEVLATLVLIGIALPVIMRGMAMANAAGTLARRETEAGSLAESKLNELVALSANNNKNFALSGDFQPDWKDYTWTAEMTNFVTGQTLGVGGGNALTQLDVHVSWPPHGPRDTITVSTVIYPVTSTNPSSGLTGGLP